MQEFFRYINRRENKTKKREKRIFGTHNKMFTFCATVSSTFTKYCLSKTKIKIVSMVQQQAEKENRTKITSYKWKIALVNLLYNWVCWVVLQWIGKSLPSRNMVKFRQYALSKKFLPQFNINRKYINGRTTTHFFSLEKQNRNILPIEDVTFYHSKA